MYVTPMLEWSDRAKPALLDARHLPISRPSAESPPPPCSSSSQDRGIPGRRPCARRRVDEPLVQLAGSAPIPLEKGGILSEPLVLVAEQIASSARSIRGWAHDMDNARDCPAVSLTAHRAPTARAGRRLTLASRRRDRRAAGRQRRRQVYLARLLFEREAGTRGFRVIGCSLRFDRASSVWSAVPAPCSITRRARPHRPCPALRRPAGRRRGPWSAVVLDRALAERHAGRSLSGGPPSASGGAHLAVAAAPFLDEPSSDSIRIAWHAGPLCARSARLGIAAIVVTRLGARRRRDRLYALDRSRAGRAPVQAEWPGPLATRRSPDSRPWMSRLGRSCSQHRA